MKDKDRSCSRLKRCTEADCTGAACENYKYNGKRYRMVEKIVSMPLTKAELLEAVDNLTAIRDEQAAESDKFATQKTEHKAAMDQLDEKAAHVFRLLKKKAREEERKCEEEYNHATGLVTTHILKENGKRGRKLEERPLTEEEKQAEMQFVANAEIDSANRAAASQDPTE